MRQESLTFDVDGIRSQSQLFIGDGAGKRPGVLVFPEVFGLGAHALRRAERLAGMGYVALGVDFFGDAWQASGMDDAMAKMAPIGGSAERIRTRATAALHALTARPEVDASRVAAIGFCFGGTMSLELARAGADVRAVVGFHSGLKARGSKEDAKNIKGRVLVCIGADDPLIAPDERTGFEAEMRGAGVDWQMHLYGNTVHSFTNEGATNPEMADRIRYNAEADARSWAAMQELFGETLATA